MGVQPIPEILPIVTVLRARRLELGLTQEAVGELIGCADRLINKFECGLKQPSPRMLVHWCEALGCRLSVAVVTTPRPRAAMGSAGRVSSGIPRRTARDAAMPASARLAAP